MSPTSVWWWKALQAFLRLALAGIFLYSGLVKAGSSEQFFAALTPFTMLPESFLQWVARWLPWIETGVGVLLVWPRTARWGAVGALLLLGAFLFLLGWALQQGIVVSCSCFGQEEPPSAARMIAVMLRDGILFLAALGVLFPPPKSHRQRPLPPDKVNP